MSLFSLNIGKYGPEETPHLNTFNPVLVLKLAPFFINFLKRFMLKLKMKRQKNKIVLPTAHLL